MTDLEARIVDRLIRYAAFWCGGGCADRCPKHSAVIDARLMLAAREPGPR